MKGQKTGGRKKGSKNKIKPPQDVIRKGAGEAVANCIATGETPLAYMLRVMRDPTVEDPRRDEMARAAAPYVHAKISPDNTKATEKPRRRPSRSMARSLSRRRRNDDSQQRL